MSPPVFGICRTTKSFVTSMTPRLVELEATPFRCVIARAVSRAPQPGRPAGIDLRAVDMAVVTGAGRGIGRETAGLLSARGYAVLVTDVNEDAARETAEMLGEHVWHLAQDVRDPDRHREVAAAAAERGP